MEGFKRLSEMDPAIPIPKFDDKVILSFRLDHGGFVV
jgi:hypothetical protein